jgi:hypothetical protein
MQIDEMMQKRKLFKCNEALSRHSSIVNAFATTNQQKLADRYRLIPAIRLNSKNLSKSGIADLQFHLNQPFIANIRKMEAVGQTAM